MNLRKCVLAFSCIFLGFQSFAQVPKDLPAELQKVLDYIVRYEYLELFGDSSKAYQFRPVDWTISDVDEDETIEVFLLIYPHFAQTAPIQIYQIHGDSTVSRVKEALAPGQPVARTEDYLSSHNAGHAVDMSLGPSATKEKKRVWVEIGMKHGMTLLEFPNFFHSHISMNIGGGYVDVTHANDKRERPSCSDLQLARPSGIHSGKLKDRDGKFLAAVVGNEVWMYRISKIMDGKYLEKEMSILKLPDDFNSFDRKSEYLRYLTKKGKPKAFLVPEQAR